MGFEWDFASGLSEKRINSESKRREIIKEKDCVG
jgi:hypothetical protein